MTTDSTCAELRRRLTGEAGRPLDPEAAEHLAACPACARFARRLDLAREELARPRSAASPDAEADPAFAARVLTRLPVRGREPGTATALGWAALRLLPAALALTLLLGWFAVRATPPPSTLLTWATLAPEAAP